MDSACQVNRNTLFDRTCNDSRGLLSPPAPLGPLPPSCAARLAAATWRQVSELAGWNRQVGKLAATTTEGPRERVDGETTITARGLRGLRRRACRGGAGANAQLVARPGVR